MGITELTDKIERLSADDYKMVIMLVNRLSEKNETMTLKRLNEDELVEELAESIRKSDMGATKSARSVSESMRKNMQYDVQFSELAEKQYDNILKYIVNV